jgi:D-amino-acid dehydrogenase
MRIAAMAEMTGYDLSISSRQIDRMLRDVETVFPGACDLTGTNPWAGLRPATPTSLPLIGRTRVNNLYLNVGQGALGFTLAAASAVRLARAVLDEA